MQVERLVAVAAGHRMGHLERAGTRVTLTYDPEWREAQGAYPLSLSMPLEAEQHSAHAVVPFLWGLLPDNGEILAQWGRRFGVSPRNPFRLISHVGEDCAGAVQFVRPERVEALLASPASPPKWLTDSEVAHRLRELGRDASAGRLATDSGQFSLPGAQRKTALFWDGSRWGIPEGPTPTTHILKPALPGFDGHAENEHICLNLARAVGIPAAASRVERYEEQVAIVVERFDRVQEGPVYVRVHQEDMCQACGVDPEFKYENQGGPGPVRIVRLLQECSAVAEDDVASFLRALFFNWLIGGTDAHAKNYAVLFGGGPRVRLAPLYDVASALPYYSHERQKIDLAMRIGGEYDLRQIGKRHWNRLATELKLPSAQLFDILGQMCEKLPDAYADVCGVARSSGLTHPILDRLGVILRKRVDNVVKQVGL